MERYVIGKDFNTKDWFVYDNLTNRYRYFDSEEEAEEYVIKIINESTVS